MIIVKKRLAFIVSSALILLLAACGSQSVSEENTSAAAETSEAAATEAALEESAAETAAGTSLAETTEAKTPEGEGGILVAYFSWSGNTEQMAQIIAEDMGADLFEIAPAAPYTDNYDELLDIARQEQADSARPELSAQVENWDSYSTVFVGYPNWWSDAPMAVYTFLESYDWTGKMLVPFNTSASGGFGRSLSGIEESAGGAEILEGLDLTEDELPDAQSRISEWLTGLGLTL